MGPPTATPANTTTPAFRPDLPPPPPLEPTNPSGMLGPTLSEMAGFLRERLRLNQKLRLTLSTTLSTTPATTGPTAPTTTPLSTPAATTSLLTTTLDTGPSMARERPRLSQLWFTDSMASTTPPTTPTLTASPPLAPSIPVTGTSTSRPTMEDTDTSESSLLLPPSQPVRQRS